MLNISIWSFEKFYDFFSAEIEVKNGIYAI